jgi:hypothetical protein
MRDDREKLVHARPRDGPSTGIATGGTERPFGARMAGNVEPVERDQDVGIEGDHVPRPS